MDVNFATQVLEAAVKAGNSREEIQKHLDSLDPSGQAKFISETAKALKLSSEPEKQPVQPSKVTSAIEGAAASIPYANQIRASIEQGLAKIDPSVSPEAYKDLFGSQDLVKEYSDERRAAKEANPLTYGAANLAGLMATVPSGTGAIPSAARIALNALQGSEEGGLKGAIIGGTIGAAGEAAAKAIPLAARALAAKSGKAAEALAEVATGATGKQLSNFKPGAGRELLDKGWVKAFDTSQNIADRLESAVGDASSGIQEALRQADASGEIVPKAAIVDALKNRISELKFDPSKQPVISSLETIIQDIEKSTPSVGSVATKAEGWLPSTAEEIKRGFKADWTKPGSKEAVKDAYQVFRNATETAADTAGVGEAFKAAKKDFGLLHPIQEAAEKRANQVHMSLSPSAIAKDQIVRRAASTSAVTLDGISNLLNSGRFGKFSEVLSRASARGANSLSSTFFILQQTNPEFRDTLRQINEEETAGETQGFTKTP